jgi:hypothetical protein
MSFGAHQPSKGLKMSKGMSVKSVKPPKGVSQGFGMKHNLRKGTEFPGMNTMETGVSDPMSDYARMTAAGGGQ